MKSTIHSLPTVCLPHLLADSAAPVVDETLAEYLPLVDQVVHRLLRRLPYGVDREELRGIGVVGLMEAARRHRPSCGAYFPAYARTRIRGAIIDELRRRDGLTRGRREKARRLSQTVRELEERLQRAPTEAELALELELTPRQLRAWQREAAEIVEVSMDAPTHGGDEPSLGLAETLADPSQEPGSHGLERQEMAEHLLTHLQGLPERTQYILTAHYFEGRRFAEIGEELGVTEARISQIHKAALLKLRYRLEASAAA